MAIADGPHAELPSALLADWLEQRAPDCWWVIDGDRPFPVSIWAPCSSNDLAAALRRLNFPLLVAREDGEPVPKAVLTSVDDLDWFVVYESRFVYPKTWRERTFLFEWRDRPGEWELIEDSATKEMEERDAAEASEEK